MCQPHNGPIIGYFRYFAEKFAVPKIPDTSMTEYIPMHGYGLRLCPIKDQLYYNKEHIPQGGTVFFLTA